MVKTIKYLAIIFGLSLFTGSASYSLPVSETTEDGKPLATTSDPKAKEVYPDPYALRNISYPTLLNGSREYYLRAKVKRMAAAIAAIIAVTLMIPRMNPPPPPRFHNDPFGLRHDPGVLPAAGPAYPARVIRVAADIQPGDAVVIRNLGHDHYEITVTPFGDINFFVIHGNRADLVAIGREGAIPVAQAAIAPATTAERARINHAIDNLNHIRQGLDDGQIGRLPDECFVCFEPFNENARRRALGFQCLFGDLAAHAAHAMCEHCYLEQIRRNPDGGCPTCQGQPLPQPL